MSWLNYIRISGEDTICTGAHAILAKININIMATGCCYRLHIARPLLLCGLCGCAWGMTVPSAVQLGRKFNIYTYISVRTGDTSSGKDVVQGPVTSSTTTTTRTQNQSTLMSIILSTALSCGNKLNIHCLSLATEVLLSWRRRVNSISHNNNFNLMTMLLRLLSFTSINFEIEL